MTELVRPHGGELLAPIVETEEADELRALSTGWPSWDLSARELCDLELILSGALSPLDGFMSRTEYESVCSKMRLPDSTLWPIPITLSVTGDFASSLSPGGQLALRDAEGVMLAVLEVQDVWKADRSAEAEAVYGTADRCHPGVAQLFDNTNDWYVGGNLRGIQLPRHFDATELRQTPAEVRSHLQRLGWKKIIAFQTHELVHRAQFEATLRAIREHEAKLLLHPVVAMSEPGDVDHYMRVRCYRALLRHYPEQSTHLALLPLSTRFAGPREALWHAIIHRNFGCTHFLVGRDHAGAGSDSSGRSFYEPCEAQQAVKKHEGDLSLGMVPSVQLAYVEDNDEFLTEEEIPEGKQSLSLSETELRERLDRDGQVPRWFTFPEVENELRRRYAARQTQGFTVFFTGLSGSGKSTIANALLSRLLEKGGRSVTLLDGDLVRKNLSSELGFSKKDRNLNIVRIGFVANEITKNGGVAICAPIAPYDNIRKDVRQLVEQHGAFILVHVATPIEVCEARDRKGLYAKARAGIVKEFTGISDAYETPQDAEIVIDTTKCTAEASAAKVVLYLQHEGYIETDS